MPQFIVTPWRFQSELLQVRREIYQLGESAPPIDDRRHAVDWIAAWKMRGNLPHAVESTAHLVDAILHNDPAKNSAFSIRATYSAAFCRFVTGFCDISQNSFHKRAMLDIAREIDMPASFVELRHEATHQELPSLERLSRSTKEALDWLWQHYWIRLDQEQDSEPDTPHFSNPSPPTKRKRKHDADQAVTTQELRDILTKFLSKRREEIKSKANDVSENSASGTSCLDLIQLCRGRSVNMALLAEVLVAAKILLPSSRTLGSSMDGAFMIWGNLLRRLTLHQKRFIHALLERMTQLLCQPSQLALQLDEVREAIYKWIDHIFSAKEWADPRIENKIEDERDMVVRECVMSPNNWTTALAKKVVGMGNEEFRETWQPLVTVL